MYRRTGGIDYVEENVPGWPGVPLGQVPSNYCDPAVPEKDPSQGGSAVYYQTMKCYYFGVRTVGGSPATTGASATGFGKVFPGGTGGAAADTSFANVPVTALASYPVSVPVGGSITITYKA
jgi:hypothetical protein